MVRAVPFSLSALILVDCISQWVIKKVASGNSLQLFLLLFPSRLFFNCYFAAGLSGSACAQHCFCIEITQQITCMIICRIRYVIMTGSSIQASGPSVSSLVTGWGDVYEESESRQEVCARQLKKILSGYLLWLLGKNLSKFCISCFIHGPVSLSVW